MYKGSNRRSKALSKSFALGMSAMMAASTIASATSGITAFAKEDDVNPDNADVIFFDENDASSGNSGSDDAGDEISDASEEKSVDGASTEGSSVVESSEEDSLDEALEEISLDESETEALAEDSAEEESSLLPESKTLLASSDGVIVDQGEDGLKTSQKILLWQTSDLVLTKTFLQNLYMMKNTAMALAM